MGKSPSGLESALDWIAASLLRLLKEGDFGWDATTDLYADLWLYDAFAHFLGNLALIYLNKKREKKR